MLLSNNQICFCSREVIKFDLRIFFRWVGSTTIGKMLENLMEKKHGANPMVVVSTGAGFLPLTVTRSEFDDSF